MSHPGWSQTVQSSSEFLAACPDAYRRPWCFAAGSRAGHNEIVHPILSPREAWEIFDTEIQNMMGISGEEFIECWESGEYAKIADMSGNRHIIRLALMIPCDSNRSC